MTYYAIKKALMFQIEANVKRNFHRKITELTDSRNLSLVFSQRFLSASACVALL